MRFGVRMGAIKNRSAFQVNAMDNDLRNSLFNFLYEVLDNGWIIQRRYDEFDVREFDGPAKDCSYEIWTVFWRNMADEYLCDFNFFISRLKEYFAKAEWYQIYELFEFVVSQTEITFDEDDLNLILEREMAGYRFLQQSGIFIGVINFIEINSLNESLTLPEPFAAARAHMEKAIDRLSQKPAPDLANAVKEAISSVEAAAREVSGKEKATLGEAIKILEKNGSIHASLKGAWDKMYGYTSDSNGIRHASVGKEDLNFNIAKYMLVTCSAFVNLLSTVSPRGTE